MANFLPPHLNSPTTSIAWRAIFSVVGSLLLVAANLLAGNTEWNGTRGPDGGLENNWEEPKHISIDGKSALINVRYDRFGQFVDYLRVSFKEKAEKDIIIHPDLNGNVSVFDFDGDGQQDIMVWEHFRMTPNDAACFYFYSKQRRTFETRDDFEIVQVSSYNTKLRMFWGGGRAGTDHFDDYFVLCHSRLQHKYSLHTRFPWFEESFYSLSGKQMFLQKTVAYGPVSEYRDILPNVPDSERCLVTTFYKRNGEIARRFYKRTIVETGPDGYPKRADPYRKQFWSGHLIPR